MAEPARTPDGVYRDPVSGAAVHVRDGSVLLSRGGKIFRVTPQEAGLSIASGDFKPATADDISRDAAAKADAKKSVATKVVEGGKAFAERAVSGALTAPTAVVRGFGAAGEALSNEVSQAEQRRPGEAVPGTGPSITDATEENITRSVVESVAGKQGADEYMRERARRGAENPLSSMAGSLLGQTVGASSALGGALSSGSRLGRVAASGIEGAGFGGSAALEEAHIRNKPLTAEQVIAHMGPMALLGLGTSALAEGAGVALRRRAAGAEAVIESTGEAGLATAQAPGKSQSAVSRWLRDYSDERTIKALGSRGSDIRRLGRTGEAAEARIESIAKEIHEARLSNGERVFGEHGFVTEEKILENLRRGESEAGEALGNFRTRINAAERSNPKLGVDIDRLVRQVDDEIIGPLQRSDVAETRARAGIVQRHLNELRDLQTAHGYLEGTVPPIERLQRYRQDLAKEIYPQPAGPGLAPLPPRSGAAAELIPVERMLEREIEAATDRIAATLPKSDGAEYMALKSKFRAFHQARQIADKAALQDLGNRVVSPSDYITGVAGAVVGGGPITGIATAIAHKTLREHSSAVAAVWARRVADMVDGKIEASLTKALGAPKVAVAPEVAARQIVERAAKKRAAVVAPLAGFATMTRAEYAKRAEELHRASDPVQTIPRIARALEPVHHHAPVTGGLANQTVQRAATYLNSKLPASGAASVSPFPAGKFAREPSVSDEELHKFAVAWDAVENPLSIVDELERGTLTQEHVDAVKAVYPALFAQIQQKAYEILARATEPPPHAVAGQLDLMLGLNGAGEPSYAPAVQAVLMEAAVMQAEQQPPPQKLGGKPPNPAGRSLTIGASLEGGQGG